MADREVIFAMFKKQLSREFDDFDPPVQVLVKRCANMRGYTSDTMSYQVRIQEYVENEVIEIVCDNGKEAYVTRYEFEQLRENMCFHVLETMESSSGRIALNYNIMSLFLRFGKKQKWKQMVNNIEAYLQQHTMSTI